MNWKVKTDYKYKLIWTTIFINQNKVKVFFYFILKDSSLGNIEVFGFHQLKVFFEVIGLKVNYTNGYWDLWKWIYDFVRLDFMESMWFVSISIYCC